MDDGHAELDTDGSVTLDAMREQHIKLKDEINRGRSIDFEIVSMTKSTMEESLNAIDDEIAGLVHSKARIDEEIASLKRDREALCNMKPLDEQIAEKARRKEENIHDLAQMRQAMSADLKRCTAEVHSFSAGDIVAYTTSLDEARALEQTLRALAADYDALFTRRTRRLCDLAETERLLVLADGSSANNKTRLAICALSQHGPGAFEMHYHYFFRRSSDDCIPCACTIGRPGVAAAVNAALVEMTRCDSDIGVNLPRRVELECKYGAADGVRCLERQMTPDAIACEIMEAVRRFIAGE